MIERISGTTGTTGTAETTGRQLYDYLSFFLSFPAVPAVPAVPETPGRALRSICVLPAGFQPIQNLALQYLRGILGLTVSGTDDTIVGAALSALVGP